MQKTKNAKGQRKRRAWITDLLTALVGTVFLLCGAVVLTLNMRQLYYRDIKALRLEEQTGLTEKQLRENYDVLIDYNLLWKRVERLEFPDFPMSGNAKIHFEEVRRIFAVIQYGLALSFVLLLAGLWGKIRRRSYRSLKLTAMSAIALPAVAGGLAVFWWEDFFFLFHQMVFDNDYWLFDPATDPVILALPDEFFFHCAAMILLCIVGGSALFGLAYRLLARLRPGLPTQHRCPGPDGRTVTKNGG